MAVCSSTSLISSTVSPLRSAARTCIASSSWWPRATSAVSVIIERLRRSRPGRVQISPQAYAVISSWKSRVKSVVPAIAAVDVRVAEHLAAHGHARVGVVGRAASRRAVLADQAGDDARAPRPARGGRRRRARRTARRARRRRSRGACRAGSRRRRRRRPRAPARRSRASRSRTSNAAERLADLDVALVVGVAQRVQQRRAARGLALEEAGAEPALGRRRSPSPACRRRGPGRSAPAHSSGVPICAPVQSSDRADAPGRGRRAASCSPTAPPTESPA